MKTSIFDKTAFIGFFLFGLGMIPVGADYIEHDEITKFPYVAFVGLIAFVIGFIGSKEKFLQMPSKVVQGTIYTLTGLLSLLIAKAAGLGILPTFLCVAVLWFVIFIALTVGKRFFK